MNRNELIKKLEGMEPDAIICIVEVYGGVPTYISAEVCTQVENVTYLNEHGDEEVGDVITIF